MKAIVALVALAMLLAACSTNTTTQETTDNSVPAPTGNVADTAAAEQDNAAAPTGEIKEFSLEAYNWGWEPATITVNQGDKVRLTLTSRDVTHGLAIKEFGVSSGEFSAGETKTVEFTADKAGTYRYYCNVFCGEGHKGMAGQLIVQ